MILFTVDIYYTDFFALSIVVRTDLSLQSKSMA